MGNLVNARSWKCLKHLCVCLSHTHIGFTNALFFVDIFLLLMQMLGFVHQKLIRCFVLVFIKLLFHIVSFQGKGETKVFLDCLVFLDQKEAVGFLVTRDIQVEKVQLDFLVEAFKRVNRQECCVQYTLNSLNKYMSMFIRASSLMIKRVMKMLLISEVLVVIAIHYHAAITTAYK